MKLTIATVAALAAATLTAAPAAAKDKSAYAQQQQRMADIPTCARNLGTIAIVEPDKQWWRELNVGSPEAIIKVFVAKSGCFKMVNRGASMASRNMERAMADAGELQKGSNLGKGQVKAVDYYIQPDIVMANAKAGGGGIGAALGAFGGMFGGLGSFVGGIAGGINTKKKEANVTLSVVNARTTEEEAMVEGFARKKDTSWGVGGGGGWSDGFAGTGGGGYGNTEIGQVIVLAYLDAYTKLVTQLGGLTPAPVAAAAPAATPGAVAAPAPAPRARRTARR